MDVSVLVRHLSALLDLDLIENARPGRERLVEAPAQHI